MKQHIRYGREVTRQENSFSFASIPNIYYFMCVIEEGFRKWLMEPRPGFEPGTSALPGRRSTRLSYRGIS